MGLIVLSRLSLVVITVVLAARPACAEDQSAISFKEKIVSIDRQIMLECIELARFNIHFHNGVNRKNFSQEWLYPMQREAGTALAFSNTVIDIHQRSRGLHDPSLISKNAQKSGVICALTGQAITGSSSAIQLLQNLRQGAIARGKGYSPKNSIATVKAIENSINEKLAQRSKLIASEIPGDKEPLYALQGRLLEHIKDQIVQEFKTWSISSRSTEWAENTFYALDSTQGFVQMSASGLTLKGFSESGLGGKASILGLVGNSIVMFNPIVKNAAGRYVTYRHRKTLNKIFPCDRPEDIDHLLAKYDLTKIPSMQDGADPASVEEKELAFLVRRSAEIDGPLNQEIAKVRKLRRIADQQAISGPLIGLTGVTRSVLNTVAYYQNPVSRVSSDSSMQKAINSNQLNLAGRIVQSAGQAYSLIDTPYTELRHYLYKRSLKKAGKLPAQRMQQRLALIDALEQRVKSSQFEKRL